jgi:hypothetical protein
VCARWDKVSFEAADDEEEQEMKEEQPVGNFNSYNCAKTTVI